MAELVNLIDPQVVAKMQQAAQPKRQQAQVPTCTCGFGVNNFKRLEGTNKVLMVHDACGMPTKGAAAVFGDAYAEAMGIVAALDPEAPAHRTLTEDDALDIDPESEAMIEAQCTDCHAPVLIDPTPIEGHEGEPRVPICIDCAKTRAIEAASKQRAIQVIRKPRVAKHQPRTSDGIDHPVTTTTQEDSNMPEIDLSQYSPAQLSALVATAQQRLEATREAEVREAVKVAKKERKKAEKKAKKAKKAEQRKRLLGEPLPEIVVDSSLTVPEFDLDEIDSLNEMPSAKERSPYNKARFRLLKEPSLDAETTTYAVLAKEHVRLAEAAKAKAAERAAKAAEKAAKPKGKKGKGKGKKIVADLNPQVAAIMQVRNCTQQEAERIAALVL